jgi:hypothetical protein
MDRGKKARPPKRVGGSNRDGRGRDRGGLGGASETIYFNYRPKFLLTATGGSGGSSAAATDGAAVP